MQYAGQQRGQIGLRDATATELKALERAEM
jgi:hypothetical protein